VCWGISALFALGPTALFIGLLLVVRLHLCAARSLGAALHCGAARPLRRAPRAWPLAARRCRGARARSAALLALHTRARAPPLAHRHRHSSLTRLAQTDAVGNPPGKNAKAYDAQARSLAAARAARQPASHLRALKCIGKCHADAPIPRRR
jgi:hypothetical protein